MSIQISVLFTYTINFNELKNEILSLNGKLDFENNVAYIVNKKGALRIESLAKLYNNEINEITLSITKEQDSKMLLQLLINNLKRKYLFKINFSARFILNDIELIKKYYTASNYSTFFLGDLYYFYSDRNVLKYFYLKLMI
ncbi:MAG: hypothetical protein R2790_02160 [Flavobacterium haoranii]